MFDWLADFFVIYDGFTFFFYLPLIAIAALVGYHVGFTVASDLPRTEKAVLAATVLVVAVACFTLRDVLALFFPPNPLSSAEQIALDTCYTYENQQDAQETFDRTDDAATQAALDADGDGVACEGVRYRTPDVYPTNDTPNL